MTNQGEKNSYNLVHVKTWNTLKLAETMPKLAETTQTTHFYFKTTQNYPIFVKN